MLYLIAPFYSVLSLSELQKNKSKVKLTLSTYTILLWIVEEIIELLFGQLLKPILWLFVVASCPFH